MRVARLLSMGLAIVLLALAPHVLSSYLLVLLTQAVISAMLAMSLDLLLGYTGLASLGHAAYLGHPRYRHRPRRRCGYGVWARRPTRHWRLLLDDYPGPRYGRLGAGAALG